MNVQSQLKEAMKSATDSCHYERYQAVYLYFNGYRMKEIAHIINRRRETVGAYVSMYRNNSLEGLNLGHSSGKPSKLSKEQQTIILETVSTKVPAYLKKLVNEEVQHILLEDESMIRDYQAIQRTWFLKGQQRIISTYGQHKGVRLVGTLNYATGEVFCAEEEKLDAAAFLTFLTATLEHYPTGKIVMILDDARIHHAKLIRSFLGENRDRLELVYLPPYSPELNLIEGLWKWLKESVINNVFFRMSKNCAQGKRIYRWY